VNTSSGRLGCAPEGDRAGACCIAWLESCREGVGASSEEPSRRLLAQPRTARAHAQFGHAVGPARADPAEHVGQEAVLVTGHLRPELVARLPRLIREARQQHWRRRPRRRRDRRQRCPSRQLSVVLVGEVGPRRLGTGHEAELTIVDAVEVRRSVSTSSAWTSVLWLASAGRHRTRCRAWHTARLRGQLRRDGSDAHGRSSSQVRCAF